MIIACCDDNSECRLSFVRLLQETMSKMQRKTSIIQFNNGESLIEACKKGTYFDLIFLDVLMEHLDGIETAVALRAQGIKSTIIFLTTSRDFAVESYQVNALSYLLKPISIKQLSDIMERFFALYYPIRIQIKDFVFTVSDLVFAESLNKKVIFHFEDQSTHILTIQLDEVATLLRFPNFLRCHRSYLVNLDHVRRIENCCFLTIHNDSVFIRQKELTAIKKQYYEYLTSL